MTWLLAVAVVVTACAEGESRLGAGTTVPSGAEDPVYVEATEILYLESFPVQVRLVVRGSLPTPCHQIRWEVNGPGLHGTIEVGLWSESDPEDDCVNALEPFEVSIPLGSFESADGAVSLNREEIGRLSIGAASIPGELSFIGAGWSFGMCGGYCVADLTFDGDELVLTGRSPFNEDPLYVHRGTPTVEGLVRLGAAMQKLNSAELELVYGCPDCADGGAAYLTVEWKGVASRHEMEFGRPPEVLAGLHGVAMALINALEACKSGDLVTVADDCEPWQGS